MRRIGAFQTSTFMHVLTRGVVFAAPRFVAPFQRANRRCRRDAKPRDLARCRCRSETAPLQGRGPPATSHQVVRGLTSCMHGREAVRFPRTAERTRHGIATAACGGFHPARAGDRPRPHGHGDGAHISHHLADHHALPCQSGGHGRRAGPVARLERRRARAQADPHRARRGPGVDHAERTGQRQAALHPLARQRQRLRPRLRRVLRFARGSVSVWYDVERVERDVVVRDLFPAGHDVARGLGAGPMRRADAGFSLIEIMVAMALLGVVLMSVARLNFTLARRFYALSGGSARDAVLAQQVNQFAALQFDSLKAKAGTITVNKPPLPYTRKITVDSLSPKLRRVTIIVTPLNPVFKPDTLVLQRTKPGNNPFNKKP